MCDIASSCPCLQDPQRRRSFVAQELFFNRINLCLRSLRLLRQRLRVLTLLKHVWLCPPGEEKWMCWTVIDRLMFQPPPHSQPIAVPKDRQHSVLIRLSASLWDPPRPHQWRAGFHPWLWLHVFRWRNCERAYWSDPLPPLWRLGYICGGGQPFHYLLQL